MRYYHLTTETWKRDQANQELDYKKSTIYIQGAARALDLARTLYREAKEDGLSCCIIRRDKRGTGRMYNPYELTL